MRVKVNYGLNERKKLYAMNYVIELLERHLRKDKRCLDYKYSGLKRKELAKERIPQLEQAIQILTNNTGK